MVLLDRNNYHQFQPMLYQVATAQMAADDIARPLRGIFRHHKTVDFHRTTAVSIDPEAQWRSPRAPVQCCRRTIWSSPPEPRQISSALPEQPEHSLPLYSVNDAERLRGRMLDVLDATVERSELIEPGFIELRGSRRRTNWS